MVLDRLGHYDHAHRALIARLGELGDASFDDHRDLWDCCEHGRECWGRQVCKPLAPHRFRLPFVGPGYLSRGILVTGMNARDSGRRNAAFEDMAEIRLTFATGQRNWGGQFHHRVARMIGLLAASQDGEPLESEMPLGALSDRLLETARVQAVQCAPGPMASRRSPTPQMWRRCPPYVLASQVQVLAPKVLVLLGVQTHRVVQDLRDLAIKWQTPWRASGAFARGVANLETGQADVFAAYHPSYISGWTRSITQFSQSLEELPLQRPVTTQQA